MNVLYSQILLHPRSIRRQWVGLFTFEAILIMYRSQFGGRVNSGLNMPRTVILIRGRIKKWKLTNLQEITVCSDQDNLITTVLIWFSLSVHHYSSLRLYKDCDWLYNLIWAMFIVERKIQRLYKVCSTLSMKSALIYCWVHKITKDNQHCGNPGYLCQHPIFDNLVCSQSLMLGLIWD